jgi:signal transduction histidine kinase/ActR/RegA family two-component response regulator
MSSERPRDERVLGALVDTLYSQSVPTTIAALLVLAIFAAFQWDRHPALHTSSWLALQSAPVISGAVCGTIYRRRRKEGAVAARAWLRVFGVNLVALGAAWAAGTILFFDPGDVVRASITVMFSGGVAAGALLGVSCHPRAFAIFALLTLVPSIVLCLSVGSSEYSTIGLGVVTFLFFVLAASRNLHQSFRRTCELRFENEDLATRLNVEKERAERALAQKSKVLAAASHDLRQPLHALGMFVELLDERLKDDAARTFLARIRASTESLGGLLNALLDISRLDASSVTVRREHFHLEPLFDQLAAEYGESARRKGLGFAVSGGELTVQSDPELVARLVRNLLSNAVRFTSRGELTLSARLLDDARVEIAVADTGPGIPEAERERIFDEFHQLGNAERDREQGLGLGLAIVRGLSHLLDHPVALRSAPERAVGSEFALALPAGDPELASAEEVAQASSRPGVRALAGRLVLIIDDEREIRDALGRLLESWGCRSLAAADLSEALAACGDGSRAPDIVLCDYRLRGGTTGAEVLAELEARWGAPVTSIIITGDTSPERIQEARRSGRAVLFKPVVPGKLRALLGALLSQEDGARALDVAAAGDSLP